jgi:hypothetical protein
MSEVIEIDRHLQVCPAGREFARQNAARCSKEARDLRFRPRPI